MGLPSASRAEIVRGRAVALTEEGKVRPLPPSNGANVQEGATSVQPPMRWRALPLSLAILCLAACADDNSNGSGAQSAPTAAPTPTPCDIFHRSAHDARAEANTVNAADADALYRVISKFYEADDQFQSCLDFAVNDDLKYGAVLEDGDLLLREAAAFSLYRHAGGGYPGDPRGRDTDMLRTLAVKQLQMVETDDASPQAEKTKAGALLKDIGED